MQVAKAVGCVRAPWRRGCQAGALALAMALTTGAWAGTASGSFAVTVDLHTASFGSGTGTGNGTGTGTGGGGTGICQTTPESPTAVASIDCHTKPLEPVTPPTPPQARQGQAYRFWIPAGNGDERYGGVDLYAGAGTITSWRVVHHTDWDYLEMTVGW